MAKKQCGWWKYFFTEIDKIAYDALQQRRFIYRI
jgi:hypothetical protein